MLAVMYSTRKSFFRPLKDIRKSALKKEYYLTDVVEIFFLSRSGKVDAVLTPDTEEV